MKEGVERHRGRRIVLELHLFHFDADDILDVSDVTDDLDSLDLVGGARSVHFDDVFHVRRPGCVVARLTYAPKRSINSN